ncbi:MAG: TIGR00725 family protein, partial [Kiloniellaceae bacterium]
ADGQVVDTGTRGWAPAEGGATAVAPDGAPVGVLDALSWLQRDSGMPCRVPVGVIGARAASAAQRTAAERLGERLAGRGLTVLCGGRQGVMEAVCRGVERAGGLSIGLLPEADPQAANPHVTVPIATGLGVARNAVIARASLCLIAVGGGYGTTAEAAFGLQFGLPVLGLLDAPPLPGLRECRDPEAAVACVARIVLALPLDDGA